MAYQGDDRYGADRWRDPYRGGRPGERGSRPDFGRGDYGRDYRGDHERGAYRQDQGRYGSGRGDYDRGAYDLGDEDRGFFDRAGDEVRSWFGDEEAQRRREEDERRWERELRLTGGRAGPDAAYGDRAGGGWGNQRGESWHRDRPGEPGWGGDTARDTYGRRSWNETGLFGGSGGGAGTGDLYGYTRAPGGAAGFGGASSTSGRLDSHYGEWRRRQIDDYLNPRIHRQRPFGTQQ